MNSGILNQGIFPRKIELFHLLFPALLLLATLLELGFGYLLYRGSSRYLVMFLANIVFLNFGHGIFSFLIAMYLPEGRALMTLENGREGKRFLAIAIATFIFFYLFIFRIPNEFIPQRIVSFIFVCLTSIMAQWHLVFQIRGIGLMYDQLSSSAGNLNSEQKRTISNIRADRNSYFLFFLTLVFPFLNLFLFTFNISYRFPFHKNYQQISVVFAIGIATFIILKQWNRNNIQWNKVIFQLRLFHAALSPISIVSLFTVKATHGLESLFFAQSAFQKSKNEKTSKRKYTIFWLALLLASILGIPRYLNLALGEDVVREFYVTFPSTGSPVINFIIVLSFVLTTLHYYLDSRLFKMRSPSVRATTGSLLKPENGTT